MKSNKRSFYILRNKVSQEKLNNGVTFSETNTDEKTITLNIHMQVNIVPEYKMFLHLYEHLLFNNVYINGVLYKKMEDLMKYCESQEISLNAFTYDDGIVVYAKINTNGLEKKACKGTRPIEWLKQDDDITNRVNIAADIIYGILVNRDKLANETIVRELEIIRSEINNAKTPRHEISVELRKQLFHNYQDTLGTLEYIDEIGTEKIINFIQEIDKEFLNPNKAIFEIVYNMDLFGDPDLETVEISQHFKDLASFKINHFNRNLNGDVKKFETCLNYKDITSDITIKDTELNALALVVDMDSDLPMDNLDNYIENQIYGKFLMLSLLGLQYGIFNYLREVKNVCYTGYRIPILPYTGMKYNIEHLNNPDVYRNRLGSIFIINDKADMDQLVLDLKEYIANLEVSEEIFNQTKIMYKNNVKGALNLEPDYEQTMPFNILYDYFTNLNEEQVTRKLETLFGFDPNLIKYNEYLKYLEKFKKNVKIISMKKRGNENNV